MDAVNLRDDATLAVKQVDLTADISVENTEEIDLPVTAETVNAPVEGISPGPSSPLVTSSKRPSRCSEKKVSATRSGDEPISSKGSPFTRYPGTKGTDSPKERRKVNPDTVTSEVVKSHESPSDPQDTGATRLERLLAEAAEEATTRQIQVDPTLMAPISPETNEDRGRGKRPRSKVAATASPTDKDEDDYRPLDSDSDSSTDSDLDLSWTEKLTVSAEKPLRKRKGEKKNSPAKKRAKPLHMLSEWMYDKYPILRYFATAPADAARHPNKYRCRVCMVELSLKTKGPLDMLRHYRTDAHLVREHRIRMETPGLALFDKQCNELSGMALKYAKERAKREYPIAPKLGDYFLRVDQQTVPEGTTPENPDKETLSQLTLLKFGLQHGGHLDSLIAL